MVRRWSCIQFDSRVASELSRCDVFHAMSSFGLVSHRTAKARFGAVTVCDRGSAHILIQEELLREEFGRWGVRFDPFDRGLVDRELSEYQECDHVVVPSTFARRSFEKSGLPPEKVSQISYGVDLSTFAPCPKLDKTFRVLFVGLASLQKGMPYLLEAVRRARASHNIELWIVGPISPEVRPWFRRLPDGCHWKGRIEREELSWYYSQASVLVMPSIQEGMALVQAQALACGIPVIGTTNSGAEDLLLDGQEGFVVPIRDSDAIADRIVRLASNPDDCARMSAAALERVKTIGGWNAYGDRMIEEYANWLGHATPPG